MKPKDIIVVIVRASVLTFAFYSGIEVGQLKPPPGTVAPFPPVGFALFALPFFFTFGAVIVFFSCRRLGRRVYDLRWLRILIDWKWGAGTFHDFSVRLKPFTLMTWCCLCVGIVGLASAYANDQDWYAYFNSAFFLSCGLGLLVGQ
jgi:hypothetical protein